MEQAATLDKILQKYVGGAGKYQIFTTFIMAWVYWAGLYALFITNFTTHVPDHRCRVPQCELENQTKVAQVILDLIMTFCHAILEILKIK